MSAISPDFPPVMAPHWKLGVKEYHLMGEVGILHEDDRVELIEGEIIRMSPIGYLHSGLGNLLVEMLGYPTRGRAVASIQNPIHLGSRSEPQPDFALLRYRPDRYRNRLPTAEDVLLVVEIADSSLRYDREVKTPLYARHGIPEYWLMNLVERQLEIHLDPDPDASRYRKMLTLTTGTIAPNSFPDVLVDLAELWS